MQKTTFEPEFPRRQSLVYELSNQLTIVKGRALKLKKIYEMNEDINHEIERLLEAIDKSVEMLEQSKNRAK